MPFLDALFGARRAVANAPPRWRRELTSLRAFRLSGLAAEAELATEADPTLRDEPRRAYLALLRRLPELVERAPQAVDDVGALIADAAVIRALRVPPFAYLAVAAALRAATVAASRGRLAALPALADPREPSAPTRHRAEADRAAAAVARAVDLSLANLPELPGRTLVALDESRSMALGAAGRRPLEIGALLAAALAKRQPEVDLVRFSHAARYLTVDPTLPTLAIAEDLRAEARPTETDVAAIFAAAGKRRYERVIVLIDRSIPPGDLEFPLAAYAARSGCEPFVHVLDLAAPGCAVVRDGRSFAYRGWSDGMLEALLALERTAG
jgi:hypothetical protein